MFAFAGVEARRLDDRIAAKDSDSLGECVRRDHDGRAKRLKFAFCCRERLAIGARHTKRQEVASGNSLRDLASPVLRPFGVTELLKLPAGVALNVRDGEHRPFAIHDA